MKNHENQPGAVKKKYKNHPGTMKNHHFIVAMLTLILITRLQRRTRIIWIERRRCCCRHVDVDMGVDVDDDHHTYQCTMCTLFSTMPLYLL